MGRALWTDNGSVIGLRGWYNAVSIGFLLVVAAVVGSVLLIQGHSWVTAGAIGLGWGSLALLAPWALGNLIAPGKLIAWRDRLIAGDGLAAASVARQFSGLLRISDASSTGQVAARSRVRLLGAIEVVLGVAWAVFFIWLPPRLDKLVELFLLSAPGR